MIELSFTDQLRDTICVDSYSLHLLHVSISRVVFCRSTPGYQIVREVSVMNGRSSVSTEVYSCSPWRRTWRRTFMDTKQEYNTLDMYEKLIAELRW